MKIRSEILIKSLQFIYQNEICYQKISDRDAIRELTINNIVSDIRLIKNGTAYIFHMINFSGLDGSDYSNDDLEIIIAYDLQRGAFNLVKDPDML